MKVICPKYKTCSEEGCTHREFHYEEEEWCQSFKNVDGNKCPDCFSIKGLRKQKIEKLNDRLGYS